MSHLFGHLKLDQPVIMKPASQWVQAEKRRALVMMSCLALLMNALILFLHQAGSSDLRGMDVMDVILIILVTTPCIIFLPYLCILYFLKSRFLYIDREQLLIHSLNKYQYLSLTAGVSLSRRKNHWHLETGLGKRLRISTKEYPDLETFIRDNLAT